jgi:hypothetical protein
MMLPGRSSILQVMGMLLMLLTANTAPAAGEGTAALAGKVIDVDGRPVEGARVFLYRSPEVRRSADFISAPTGRDGLYRLNARPGSFWAIARLKKVDEYGPLMPGDKHSGDPVEIELATGREGSADFTVADLKDARKRKAMDHRSSVKISGRIMDEQGAPMKQAYAFAHRNGTVSGIPDYLSAWADEEGRFTLHVPPGRYYLGAAFTMPPDQSAFIQGVLTVETDLLDVKIIRTVGKNK